MGLFGGVLAVGFVFDCLLGSEKGAAALQWALALVEQCEALGDGPVAKCPTEHIEAGEAKRAELLP